MMEWMMELMESIIELAEECPHWLPFGVRRSRQPDDYGEELFAG